MARSESDREDLLAEATAMPRRAEFAIPFQAKPIVAGFRSTGELSIYFGSDPVFHFDAVGRLRRAFCDNDLYRSQGSTLARLVRHRTPTETQLQRHDLSVDELEQFRIRIRGCLKAFRDALVERKVTVLRQVPDNDDMLADDLISRIDAILRGAIELAPAIKGRR